MLKDKISVTVIIPAYSNSKLLLETLKSVYIQNGNFSIDIFVIDDNSPKPLGLIIKKVFPRVKVYRNKVNLKPGSSRNQALKYVHSEFVAFLDSDDIWKNNFLIESIKHITDKNTAGSVVMSSSFFDKKISLGFRVKIGMLSTIRDFLQTIFYIFNNRMMPQSSFYLCQLSHQVFRTSKINGISFDEKYIFGGEDWKFTLQAMDRGNITIVPKKLVRYRYHLKNFSQQNENLRYKWDSYGQLFSELKKRKISNFMTWLFDKYINIFKNE